MIDAENQRIADQAWAFWCGYEHAVVAWLQSIGCTLVALQRDGWILDGATGIRCALVRTDPVAVVAAIGLLLFGEHWPRIAGPAMKDVMKRWNAETKARRKARSK